MTEGRSFERLDLPVEVEYTVPGKGWVKGEATAKNISLGGIQFQVKERLDLGCRLSLRIYLPHRARPTTASGELVWLKENHPRGKGFDAGVRFTKADPFDLEELLTGLER